MRPLRLASTAADFASLEAIVNARPDFLLVSEQGDLAEDDGRAFLLRPALEQLYWPEKRIVIPERLSVCGGVMLADALDALVTELERVGRMIVMYGRPPLGKSFLGVSANQSGSGHVYGLEMRPLTAGPDGDRGSNSNHCRAL